MTRSIVSDSSSAGSHSDVHRHTTPHVTAKRALGVALCTRDNVSRGEYNSPAPLPL